MTAPTVSSQVVYHGISPWLVVSSSSAIGDLQTQVGPVADLSQTQAIAGRVQALVSHAEADFGQAMAAHPELCARCVRTLLRSSLGDLDAAHAVMAPTKPGDADRVKAAWTVIGSHVEKLQGALQKLCAEAGGGAVLSPEMAAGILDHYRKGGAPMHVGAASRWSDYKLCTCADPGSGTEATMMVGQMEIKGHPNGREMVGCAGDPSGQTRGACGCGCTS